VNWKFLIEPKLAKNVQDLLDLLLSSRPNHTIDSKCFFGHPIQWEDEVGLDLDGSLMKSVLPNGLGCVSQWTI
jgi:hypothetical protein